MRLRAKDLTKPPLVRACCVPQYSMTSGGWLPPQSLYVKKENFVGGILQLSPSRWAAHLYGSACHPQPFVGTLAGVFGMLDADISLPYLLAIQALSIPVTYLRGVR